MLKTYKLIGFYLVCLLVVLNGSAFGQEKDLTSITRSDASVFSISSGAQNSQIKSIATKAGSSQTTSPFALPLSLLLPQQVLPSGVDFELIDAFSGVLEHRYLDMNAPGNGGFDLKIWRLYTNNTSGPWADYKEKSNLGDRLTSGGYVPGSLGSNWDVHFGLLVTIGDFLESNWCLWLQMGQERIFILWEVLN